MDMAIYQENCKNKPGSWQVVACFGARLCVTRSREKKPDACFLFKFKTLAMSGGTCL
jgi:hypothetical protein